MDARTPEFCILMTATISPSVSEHMNIVRRDPEIRRRDYEDALRFWLSKRRPWISAIVFAENSGANLDSLAQIVAEENPAGLPVDFISCSFSPPPPGMHYGYSEVSLICHALRVSERLRETKYFIKATGRYIFPDIDHLVKSLPADFDVAVDSKQSRFWSRDRHYFTHFALAVFRTRFFGEFLIDLPSQMVPAPPWTRAQFIETVLYDKLRELPPSTRIIMRWGVNCEPVGVGANGDRYGTTKKKIQGCIRSICRFIFPKLWI